MAAWTLLQSLQTISNNSALWRLKRLGTLKIIGAIISSVYLYLFIGLYVYLSIYLLTPFLGAGGTGLLFRRSGIPTVPKG